MIYIALSSDENQGPFAAGSLRGVKSGLKVMSLESCE